MVIATPLTSGFVQGERVCSRAVRVGLAAATRLLLAAAAYAAPPGTRVRARCITWWQLQDGLLLNDCIRFLYNCPLCRNVT